MSDGRWAADRGEEDPAATSARIHRALASVTRVRLFRLLEQGPTDIASLVATTGLHYNTVRTHLEVLTEAGLVARAQRATGRPGRPTVVYRLADPPEHPLDASARAGRILLETLAAVVSEGVGDPASAAAAAAEPIGRAQLPAHAAALSLDEALHRVSDLLDDLGFDPELVRADDGSAQVRLRRCPFDDLARQHGDVVCAAHVGIIRGALAELGADVEVALRPFVTPALCIADIVPVGTDAELPLMR